MSLNKNSWHRGKATNIQSAKEKSKKKNLTCFSKLLKSWSECQDRVTIRGLGSKESSLKEIFRFKSHK